MKKNFLSILLFFISFFLPAYIALYNCNSFIYSQIYKLLTRGGIEDTRLEAKAKDTKKSEAKDSLSEDRHSRGQGQEFWRPRTKDTSASALQKKKKVSTKIFQAISTKKRFPKNFSSAPQNFNNSKIVLSSSRGQVNFHGLEASKPRPRTSKCVLEAKDVLEDSTSAINSLFCPTLEKIAV